MDNCTKFDETFLPNRESLCSNLNVGDVTQYDNEHAKNKWSTFAMKI